jgi:hypothetical protein
MKYEKVRIVILLILFVATVGYLASLPDWPVSDNGLFGSDGATKSQFQVTAT